MRGLVEHPGQLGLKMTPLPLFQSRQMSCLEVCAESRRPKKRKSEPSTASACWGVGGRSSAVLTLSASEWPLPGRPKLDGEPKAWLSPRDHLTLRGREPLSPSTALKGGCSSRPPGDPQSFPAWPGPWARDQGHSTAYLPILICAAACQTGDYLGLAWWSAHKAGRAPLDAPLPLIRLQFIEF